MASHDPIWQRLREDGRYNLLWLAQRTGYSHGHVRAVAVGMQNPGPRFRAACARVLGLPETELFHGREERTGVLGDTPIRTYA